MKNNQSRRKFIKTGLVVVSSLPVVGSMAMTKRAHADESLKPLDDTNPQAKALGYHEDGSKVDTATWTKKAGEEGKNQKCGNCALYLQGGLKVEGKEGEYGKCALFPANLVAAEGWCNSWAPKA